MIKHIVAWKLKENAEGASKAENAQKIISALEELNNLIPEIVQLEAGENFNPSEMAYDLALYTSFVNQEDLDTYQNHPEHMKVREFVGKVVEERVVVDYEM